MIILPRKSARNQILQVASDLFYREGIRAVGIDRIIAESGISKASFYRNFASKDDLVTAYLEYHQDLNAQDLEEVRLQHPDSASMQLHALIDRFVQKIKKPRLSRMSLCKYCSRISGYFSSQSY
ncbi:TetR/AcrR family transcriptional regulator [Paenibacillus sp. P25]|nr:TetR/AcrR family transcriptional regulator [Paenibacillus sp. P25]